jgi:hypothetical protein
MFHAESENTSDMVIGEGIEHYLTVTAEPDELVIFEHSELMGTGGGGQTEELSHITDAHFFFEQGMQDTDPGAVAEDFKQFSEVIELFIGGSILIYPVDILLREGEEFGFSGICHITAHPFFIVLIHLFIITPE